MLRLSSQCYSGVDRFAQNTAERKLPGGFLGESMKTLSLEPPRSGLLTAFDDVFDFHFNNQCLFFS